MEHRSPRPRVAGIVLVGTYPWNYPKFDALMPRALLPVAHRPLMFYALAWLQSAGIDQSAVCGNRKTEAVRSMLHRLGSDLTLTYHQDVMPRGSAGSIRDAALTLDADTFVVVEGTSIPALSLPDLLQQHTASGAPVTMVIHQQRGASGHAVDTPSGIYVINRRALDLVPASGFCDVKENFVPALYRAGIVVAPYRTPHPSARIMSPATYLAANEWLVESLASGARTAEGYTRTAACVAHHEASVSPQAVLVGPVLIGAGARIEAGATIIGPSSIGHDVVIERGAVVARSSVWRKCIVGQHAIADRVILADWVHLPPHSHTHQTVMADARPRRSEVASPERLGAQPWRRASLDAWNRVQRLLLDPELGESATPR